MTKKKLILLTICICAAIPIHAQTSYGIEAGGVLDDILASNVEATPKFTYRMGAFVNYDKFWGSSIYYVKKGAKMSEFIPQYADYIQKIDASFNYVEVVPLFFKFKPLIVSRNFKMIPVIGMYGAYGFSGKGSLVGMTENNRIFHREIKQVFKDEQFTEDNKTYNFKSFQPFDAGGRFGIDFIYNKFILRVNCSLGFIDNISPYDKRMKHNSLDLSLCYLLK
jgi:hypothetical protein